MDMFDFAGMLFGGIRTAPDATTVTATGAGASEDGEVGITLDADVTPAEDTGVDGETDQTIIDLPTSPDVDEGDEVIVTLVGDGPLKTPVVTANPGSGDRMRALANSAKTVADAAQAVANAINQHFWHDDSGAHVTMATQDEWEQEQSGPNSLWNALGMLFRDGLNNLLAILPSGVAIYDGNGNDEENVVASFTGDEIHLGDFRISSLDLGPSLQGGWLYSDSLTMASAISQTAGIMTNGVHVGDGSVDANVTDRTSFGYRIPIESGGSIVGYDTASAQKTARETFAWYRSPVGTYTGANNTGTASSNGWQLTYFNVVVAEHGSPRTYDYTFRNGVLTAKRDCVLEISGVMNWTDEIAGRRGFGVFEGATVGSGTEHSAFQSFAANLAGNRKSVVFPPKVFALSAGSSLTFGRNQQQNAVYQNGYNFSWVTIRVVG
jgi:hypothetical protein